MRNTKLIVLLSVVSVLVIGIIACCATFLVRDVEAYNYYSISQERDADVIAAAGIKHNTSMFLIDDVAVKSRVEQEYYDIEVINVERKFPDRVSVNYVVYERLFQYKAGNKFYKCYASGRIGEESDNALGGYFTVKPKHAVSTAPGAYFQSPDGYDFSAIKIFIDTMHTMGLNDSMMTGYIDFIDLTREGYIYIRTKYGSSIELKCTLDDFSRLLENGWNVFVGLDELEINNKRGTIHVYSYAHNSLSYVETDGNDYYLANYRNL